MLSVPAPCRGVRGHESVGPRWSTAKKIVSIGPAACILDFEVPAFRTQHQFPAIAVLVRHAQSNFVKVVEHLMAQVQKCHELLCKIDNVGDAQK